MDFWTDVRDWLGGWPMQYVLEKDVIDRMEALGLELLSLKTGEANTEFVFRRKGASNWWDEIVKKRHYTRLDEPVLVNGHAWGFHVPELARQADSPDSPYRSTLTLTENGKMLPFRHARHEAIQKFGAGQYSHWQDTLIFSTTDNSSPLENGREYGYWLEG